MKSSSVFPLADPSWIGRRFHPPIRPTKAVLRGVLLASVLILSGSVAAQTAEGNVENGKRLFVRDGCWECHGYAGQGSRDGARIANTSLNAQGLIRYVRRPTGAMPAFIEKVATDQELTDIWAYLKSMPAPKPAKDIPLLNQIKNRQ